MKLSRRRHRLRAWHTRDNTLMLETDGALDKYITQFDNDSIWVAGSKRRHSFTVGPRDELTSQSSADASTKVPDLEAPVPGLITAVNVEAGDRVQKGDVLVVMEAMKMFHHITAEDTGTILAVH